MDYDNELNKKMYPMVRIVMTGLLVRNKKEWKQVEDGFKENGFKAPKLVKQFKTLSGHGGEGGRNDVIADVVNKDVSKLAIHPFHLNGLFSWADDYVANNREIIPKEVLSFLITD